MYIRNFLTLLRRYTASSVLNIIGMAIAFAAIYLITLQVTFDLSYNKPIVNSERIYRLEYPSWVNDGRWECRWNRQLPDEICSACPEIEASGSIEVTGRFDDYSIKRNATIDNFRIGICEAEREGLDVFPFEWTIGNIDDFRTPSDMVISESTARRLNLSVGDVLYVGRGATGARQLTIVAIFKDFPEPSSLSMTEGWSCLQPQENAHESNWNNSYYIRLKEGADPEAVRQKIIGHMSDIAKKSGLSDEEIEQQMGMINPRLTPITELYFATDSTIEGMQGNRSTTYSLIAIALLILAISFINFINFFFALIPSRIKAVNNYKIFGAPTSKLRLSFLMETVGLILVSLFVAAMIVVLVADTPLAGYISTSVAIDDNWRTAAAMAAGLIVFGIAVSIYPAWYITHFSPAFVIKGSFSASRAGKALRYTLVGIQYTISIALIICSIFIQRQHNYMIGREMGFDKEQLLTVEIPLAAIAPVRTDNSSGELDYTRRDAFSDKILQNPMIRDIAYGDGWLVNTGRMNWGRELDDKQIYISVYPVSWNFLQMMGINIVEGRDFMPSDEESDYGVLIFNQTAQKQYEITLESKMMAHVGGSNATIAGFCEDFNFKPAHYGIGPFAFIVYGKWGWCLPTHAYIRIAAGADIDEVKQYIAQTVTEFAPAFSKDEIEVRFFDQELESLYNKETKLSTLVSVFSLLSIIISAIGVFGLVLFETQYRRREIGIRRVHGATAGDILAMFNRKYLYIVAVCSVIAVPASYFIISRWLEQFTYRAPMVWWVYAIAILIVALITAVTVTLRSWKAVNENPTNSIMH